MEPLTLALVLISAVAFCFGYWLGLGFGYMRDGQADPKRHPILHLLAYRGTRPTNFIVALLIWAAFLYGIPKVIFLLCGIEDITAFGMSFGVQLLFGYVGLEIGERRYKHVA